MLALGDEKHLLLEVLGAKVFLRRRFRLDQLHLHLSNHLVALHDAKVNVCILADPTVDVSEFVLVDRSANHTHVLGNIALYDH